MNDFVQTYMSVAFAGFAGGVAAVLGLVTVSNSGPIFGIDTRNPLGFNAINNPLSAEY